MKTINDIITYVASDLRPQGKRNIDEWEQYGAAVAHEVIKQLRSLDNEEANQIAKDILKTQGVQTYGLWIIEDVQGKAEELGYEITEEQARDIFDNFQNGMDCEYGLTWQDIETAIEYYCEAQGIEATEPQEDEN